MTKEIGEINTRSVVLKLLGSIDYQTGRHKQAYENLRASRLINDSLLSERNTRIVTELETKYKTAEKEKEIAEQETTIARQDAKIKFRNTLILSISLLLGLAALGIMYFRQKQMLARKDAELEQQRRIELEKTQQLHAMNAMIDGQEAERQRIARELHDGLGGLISTVQLHFDAVEAELEELRRLDAYITAQELLKDTGTELRRIAHDMMPGALIKLGLVEAVSDLCKKIDRSGQISVFFQSLGMENIRLDPTLETSLYRIIQELTNNILKHAEASELIVQITQRNDQITVVVEDDGKGFDLSKASQKEGMGLSGIFSRAEHIHAEVDLDTAPGRGTTFTIEVPYQKF